MLKNRLDLLPHFGFLYRKQAQERFADKFDWYILHRIVEDHSHLRWLESECFFVLEVQATKSAVIIEIEKVLNQKGLSIDIFLILK